jgi:hypothetical protein
MALDWTVIEHADAQSILDRVHADRDTAPTVGDTVVETRTLPFYRRYRLYRLTNRATIPAFSKLFLGDGSDFLPLNGTSSPIYEASEREAMRLTDDTVAPYVEFFITHVQGSEGDIFLLKDPRTTPLLEDVDAATRQQISAHYRPIEWSRDAAAGVFRLHASFCYGRGLLVGTLVISEAGKLSFTDMSVPVTWLPAPLYHSCFISYSQSDETFATKLTAALEQRGVKTWFAPKDIVAGRKLHEQIVEAIWRLDKLLIVLSESSVHRSWVSTEVLEARRRERERQDRMLFPVRIAPFDVVASLELFDADEGRDLGRELRSYFIPDFSKWENDDEFGAALNRLMDALKKPAWSANRQG